MFNKTGPVNVWGVKKFPISYSNLPVMYLNWYEIDVTWKWRLNVDWK